MTSVLKVTFPFLFLFSKDSGEFELMMDSSSGAHWLSLTLLTFYFQRKENVFQLKIR